MNPSVLPETIARPKFEHSTVASGANAIVLAATPGVIHVIDWISWSYASAPTNGRLKIDIGGVTYWDTFVTEAGVGYVSLSSPLYSSTPGEEIVITLLNGGVASKLNVRYR